MKVKEPKSETVKEDVWKPSTCLQCYNSCGLLVHRVNGVAVGVEGNPDCPQNMGRMCAKGKAALMTLYSPSRVKTPLKRTNPEKGIGVDPKWVEISWEEALDTIAEKLKKVREEDARGLVGAGFNRMFSNDFQFSTAFGSAFGTPSIYTSGSAGYFCGNNIHPIWYLVNGTFHSEPDFHYCNYFILIGAQHGFMVGEDTVGNAQRCSDARLRGMKVVVVDPICTPAAAKADDWLPIRPGTDAAFTLAVINVLLNEVEIYDADYIKKHTNGPYLVGSDGHYLRDRATKKPLIWDAEDSKAKTYDASKIKDFALEGKYKVNGTDGTPAFQLLKEHVKQYTCEEVARTTTIPAQTIRRIAKEFGEAARIGSKIAIDGKELPYRPACVYWRKGTNQHKHSMLTGWSIQLMNSVVGAVDVPGGMCGINPRLLPGTVRDFSFGPKEGPDGLLEAQLFRKASIPWPPREVKRPQSVITLNELFPTAVSSTPMWDLVVQNPEKFKLPYKPQVLMHSWGNMVMTSVDPKVAAETFKAFPFQFSFAFEIDETAELADIVLPDVHYLESLDPALQMLLEASGVGLGNWTFQVRTPAVKPPPGVRSFHDTLLEVADRVGFLKDIYHMINVLNHLKEPYKLDLDKKYSWAEIIDIWAKGWFGPEHGLDYFREHGFLTFPKKVEETYTTPFNKPRIPIYLEHWINYREDVKRVTEEMGLTEWDVSDYQPIPDWKPCPAYEEKSQDYDLYAVTYRSPFHDMSRTSNNIWLNELSEYHPYTYYILINSQVAKKKGIEDRDLIRLETKWGNQVEGRAKVTDCVHPEVVGIAGAFGGHWAKRLRVAKGKGVHYNSLIPTGLDRMDMINSAIDCCVKIKISKVSRGTK
jgi:molybdopterin-containing oxidoreductase family molybdopterin binding subunit